MIRANNILAAMAVAAAVSISPADPVYTSEITGNDIWAVAGNGDTLWMLTSRGVNYTILSATAGDRISWGGFYSELIRTVWARAFSYGSNSAAVSLIHSPGETTNRVLIFDAVGRSSSVFTPPFNVSSFETDTELPSFHVNGMVYMKGSWWFSCGDGGLVKTGESDTLVFVPGIDSAFTFSTFTKQRFPHIPSDVSIRTTGIDTDPQREALWVACERTLWKFEPDSIRWTLIDDTAGEISAFLALWVRDSASVFAAVALGAGDTALYKFRDSGGAWSSTLSAPKVPAAMTFAGNGYIYLVEGNDIKLRHEHDSTGLVEKEFARGSGFAARKFEHDVANPYINHIFHTFQSDTGLLWIATSEGLFLSYVNPSRPDSLAELFFFSREKDVESGLRNRNVYAFPGILNDGYRNQRAVFAYNLKEDDRVTIDIYDWNMDHVVRIVERGFRYAGRNRPDGRARSAVASEDFWDGTINNKNGTPVSPGIYYFRISSENSGRAFGKIVVAKPGR